MVRRLLLVLVMVLGVHAWDAPAAEAAGNGTPAVTMWGITPDRPWSEATVDGDCGGPWQVPCLNVDLSPATPFNGCNTDRLNRIGLLCTPCGGVGDLTCNYGPKCSAGARDEAGFCQDSGFSSEPTANISVMPTLSARASAGEYAMRSMVR